MNAVRRRLILSAGAAAGVTVAARVAGQSGLIPPDAVGPYGPGQSLTYSAHKVFTSSAMAREFAPSQISAKPYQNGNPPKADEFQRHIKEEFSNWRLVIEGLVDRPIELSVTDIRNMPMTTQITHLACEEGWSYIAQWGGVRLSELLAKVGVKHNTRYVVYSSIQPSRWESVDIEEALHPQTIVAHQMNGASIPTGFGAPLRMRVPRQLGYKSIKYLNRITVVEEVKSFRNGLGSGAAGAGYQWFAGI